MGRRNQRELSLFLNAQFCSSITDIQIILFTYEQNDEILITTRLGIHSNKKVFYFCLILFDFFLHFSKNYLIVNKWKRFPSSEMFLMLSMNELNWNFWSRKKYILFIFCFIFKNVKLSRRFIFFFLTIYSRFLICRIQNKSFSSSVGSKKYKFPKVIYKSKFS